MKATTLTLILPMLLLCSCAHKEEALDPSLHGFFPEDVGETRKPAQFADAMIASGARADAMLAKQHFDGGHLNSLGEDKLAYMLKDDDAPTPMTVYLKFDEGSPLAKSRQASVVTYLKDLGLAENQITIVYGENPESRSMAGPLMATMSKAQTGDAAGGGAGAAPAAGGSSEAPPAAK